MYRLSADYDRVVLTPKGVCLASAPEQGETLVLSRQILSFGGEEMARDVADFLKWPLSEAGRAGAPEGRVTVAMRRNGMLVGLTGLGLLIGTFFAIRSTLSFRSISATTEGVVVELAESRSDGSRTYQPVVEWTSPDGMQHRFTASVSTSRPSYSPGQAVKLRYDPANPESARIDSFLESWLVSLILGLMRSIFTAVGAGFWIRARRTPTHLMITSDV